MVTMARNEKETPTINNTSGPHTLFRGHALEGAKEEAVKLCLWTHRIVNTPSLLEEIRRALGVIFATSLLKVVKQTSMRKASVRWDLFVRKPNAQGCLDRLSGTTARRCGWFVREDRPYAMRVRMRKEKLLKSPSASTTKRASARSRAGASGDIPGERPRVRVASLNINGLASKKAELGLMCAEKNINVLCLQETLWKPCGWHLKLPGYQVIGTNLETGKLGRRGVAVAVEKGCLAIDCGLSTPWAVFVRVLTGGLTFIVGSVYIPGASHERQEAMRAVKMSLRSLRKKFPGIPVIMGGDWNKGCTDMMKHIAKWDPGLVLKGFSGSDLTWHRKDLRSAIDYFVVEERVADLISSVKVDRTWDTSDHWPIMLSFPLEVIVPEGSGLRNNNRLIRRLKPEVLRDKGEEIRMNNRFLPLLEEGLEYGEAERYDEFLQAAVAVALDIHAFKDVKLQQQGNRKRRRRCYRLSSRARKAIKRRRETALVLEDAYTRLRKGRDLGDELKLLKVEYLTARKEATVEVRKSKEESWLKFIERGVEDLGVNGDYRQFWRWLRTVTDRGRQAAAGMVPVKDPISGELLVEPGQIMHAWAQHYGKLARDETGHSQSLEHWYSIAGVPGHPLSALEGMDDPILWSEVRTVLSSLKDGKAPGESGLPGELLKVAADDIGTEESGPSSPFGKVVFKFITSFFEGPGPCMGLCKALVVSIPKKGDPTMMDNYRGISLVETLLKVACSVAARRISAALEREKRLSTIQAGFRSKQECAAQVITLYEVCRRRTLEGEPTYLAFLDFRKAYDTVPHMALMYKLEAIGVRGRMQRFIGQTYARSTFSVLFPSCISEEVHLKRGLRQGCPMSPILFNVFINDIFEECRDKGVEVAGIEGKMPGLLFADDAVLCAESIEDLKAMLEAVERWAARWEMGYGIDKCGAMVVNGSMTELAESQLTLQGVPLPVVKEYTYLGIPFDNTWDLRNIIKRREVSARKALNSLSGVMGSPSIPLKVKVTLIKSCLIPVICYGGELLGMNQQNVVPLQGVLDEALRRALKSGRSITAAATLRRELGVPTVMEVMSSMRARAFIKFKQLNTWVSKIADMNCRSSSRLGTWLSCTHRWLKRFSGAALCEVALLADKTGKKFALRVKEDTCAREWDRDVKELVTPQRYEYNKYWETRGFINEAATKARLALGVRELAKCRVGAMWTGRRAACAGLISALYKERCPCCEGSVRESLYHLLWECKRWKRERLTMRRALPGILRRALRDTEGDKDELLILLLGGGASGEIQQLWLLGDSAGNPGWIHVARFLQDIYRTRLGLLWKTLTLPTMSRRLDRYGSS